MTKLIQYLDNRSDNIIKLLQQLIKAPSENPPGNEVEVTNIIIESIENLGIKDYRVVQKSKKRPNIIARIEGKRPGRHLILNAHTDTMPAGDSKDWLFDPFSGHIENGEIYGRGALDMKATIAAYIEAAGALIKNDLKGSLTLLFTADEEAGGSNGMSWILEKENIKADAAIIGEASGIKNSFEYLDIAERGLFWFDLIFKGDQMHSSMLKLKPGVSASISTAKTINEMHSKFEIKKKHILYPQGSTLNIGAILKGGLGYSTVPGRITVGNDLRFVPGINKSDIETEIKTFINDLIKKDNSIQVEMNSKMYVEPAEISRTELIVEVCEKAYEQVFGYPPTIGGYPAATDARFLINQSNIPTIPAFGPGLLSRAHAPNERVPIDHVIKATKIYALASMYYLNS